MDVVDYADFGRVEYGKAQTMNLSICKRNTKPASLKDTKDYRKIRVQDHVPDAFTPDGKFTSVSFADNLLMTANDCEWFATKVAPRIR